MELDAEIDRLYGVPLDEFVKDRDELAKRLRKEGDREAADEVKQLRKPTAGAWALNQAVRRRRKETDGLLGAGEKLRAAHEALMSGGDPAALREAMQEERALAGALADCAEAIASETGKSGPALRERVRSTLHAASVDEEAREELERGRFVREREAVGLGPFGGGTTSSAPVKRGSAAKRGAPKGGSSAKAAGKAATGKAAGGKAATAAERKAAKREAAEREAAERREAEERELAARIEAAEDALAEAGSELEDAQAAHSDAVDELESARDALRAAEEEERATRRAAREREREVAKRERELERLRAKRT